MEAAGWQIYICLDLEAEMAVPPDSAPTDFEFDAFISYSRADAILAGLLEEAVAASECLP